MGKANILEIHGTGANFGGASNGTKFLYEEIRKIGHNIYLCYNKHNSVLSNSLYPEYKLGLSLSSKNIINVLYNILALNKFIKKNKINIIHSHHRNDNIYACLIKIMNKGIKIVYTVHGPQVVKKEKQIFYKILGSINRYMINSLVDKVVYISSYTKEATEKYFAGVCEHIVIHNGTPIPSVNKKKEEVIESLGLPSNAFIVSHIGVIGGFKRPKIIVEIAEKLKKEQEIYILFVGDGDEKKDVMKLCEKKGLDNVRFVKTTADIGNIINASNIVISASLEEGFGRTLIEAMSMSKPVIAFNSGGPKEIILNTITGYLINNRELDTYSSMIKQLFIDKWKCKKMGQMGYLRYLEKFSVDKYANAYLQQFNKLL